MGRETPTGVSPDVRRFLIEATVGGLAFALVLVVRFYMPAGGGLDVTGHPVGRDFLNVWGAPRIAAGQGAAALYDLQTYFASLQDAFGAQLKWFFNWSYPPSALMLLTPFSFLPYGAALALWTFVGLAAFSGAVAAGVDDASRRVAGMVAVLSPAAFICVVSGQNGLLTGAALLVALLSLETRPILAGVLLGLLTTKPHLGLLLPVALLAIGAWRTIAVAALTAVALALASVALYGVEPWRLWMTTTSAYQLSVATDLMANFNRYMLLSIFASMKVLGAPNALAWAAQAAGAAAGVAATWIAFRRTADPARRAAVLILATLLTTPYAFNYDLTAMTGAVLWLVVRKDALTVGERRAYGALLLLPVAIAPLHMIPLPLGPVIVAAGLYVVARPLLGERSAKSVEAAV